MALVGKGSDGSGTRYAEIGAKGECDGGRPDPVAYAKSLGYSDQQLGSVPQDAVMSLGCGNPVAYAAIEEGKIVLDLGSGGGLDAFLSAQRVGPSGRVIGIDATSEMVKRATDMAKKAGYRNVEFRQAPIERLPLDNGSIDLAISNCVMNHCSDKVRAFKEVHRVLKPAGRIYISDLVTAGTFCEEALRDEVWGEWLSAALPKDPYLRAIVEAGFSEVTVETETRFAMAERDDRLSGRIVSIQLTARK